ncbi:MAG: hypothetical protein FWF88_09625 [Peptococcaceae bacterium]|nr:hypothetical protein [Peptococcaceae bacterium]
MIDMIRKAQDLAVLGLYGSNISDVIFKRRRIFCRKRSEKTVRFYIERKAN